MGCSPWGFKELDLTEATEHIHSTRGLDFPPSNRGILFQALTNLGLTSVSTLQNEWSFSFW